MGSRRTTLHIDGSDSFANIMQGSFVIARRCPGCNKTHPADGFIRAATSLENNMLSVVGKQWRAPSEGPALFSYHRCSACDLLFAPTYLTSAGTRGPHKDSNHPWQTEEEQYSRLTHMEYYATASRYMAEARVYCELAPATGHFLVLARQHYALEKAIFVEPSTAAWPGLKEMAAGLTPLMVASVEEGNDVIPEGSIDLVVAVHSLEQLLIPAETLRWIKRMLSRTGIAVFVVYNERSVPARLLRKRWPPYLLQPPQMYNPTSLRTSLEAQGLNVRTIVPTATHISLGELIAQGVFALTNRRYRPTSLSWPMRLNLGDIMAIASASSC